MVSIPNTNEILCNLHVEIKRLELTTAYCGFSYILPKIKGMSVSVLTHPQTLLNNNNKKTQQKKTHFVFSLFYLSVKICL